MISRMVTRKPRIVIIGAGMAGLTAANKLYKSAGSAELFELFVVEGGTRIGGRINTSELNGDRIEMGATWIHGINGSPIHQIAREINSLKSEQPWERMNSLYKQVLTIAEGGFKLDPSLVEPVSNLFNKLMSLDREKLNEDGVKGVKDGDGNLSLGSFLRQGLEAYWDLIKDRVEGKMFDNWSRKQLEEAIFAMHESLQRTYTSASDLNTVDYNAEKEYKMIPGEEITIAKGYSTIIESLASILPSGTIQLRKKVNKIEWKPDGYDQLAMENGDSTRPVKLHFSDGSTMSADHVVVTVSLGVLKQGILEASSIFHPPLPSFKTQAISRLGFGVVDKLFLQLSPRNHEEIDKDRSKFPFLQMVFHQSEKDNKIPLWIRKTAFIYPIYSNSNVLLSWYAGEEALELESLTDEEIINGVSTTISNLLSDSQSIKFGKVLKSQWGTDPLFLGSYSYVAVGSSGKDLDSMAEPLPENIVSGSNASPPPLQILFAGEATHRSHYSTTHGAYFSGLREANRLLQHYKGVVGV